MAYVSLNVTLLERVFTMICLRQQLSFQAHHQCRRKQSVQALQLTAMVKVGEEGD